MSHYALDLDGVILDFTECMRSELKMPHAPPPYSFHKWGWDLPSGIEPCSVPGVLDAALYRTNLNPEAWLTKYANSVLYFLADKDVTIITARSASVCMRTADYIAYRIDGVRGVVCNAHGKPKADAMLALGCTHIIDDYEGNLVAARDAGLVGICVDWAWNQGWDGERWTV